MPRTNPIKKQRHVIIILLTVVATLIAILILLTLLYPVPAHTAVQKMFQHGLAFAGHIRVSLAELLVGIVGKIVEHID